MTLKVRVGMETYSLLQRHVEDSTSDEASAVKAAIERGMERYWSHWFEITASDYERLRKRYRQCQKDNELLTALMDHNRELSQMVEGGKPS